MSLSRKLALALSVSSIATLGLASVPAHAATSSGALLVGKLGIEGGAYPGTFHPTAGSVEVDFDSIPLALEKHVGSSGRFRIPLGPGSYTVVGCGPSAASGTQTMKCSPPQSITLRAGEVDHITLIWALAP